MDISLAGYTEDPNDETVNVFPGSISEQIMSGPIEKNRLEDMQLWGALQALAANGAMTHPVSIRPGEDPPDRIIEIESNTWGVELTELTMFDLRGTLARTRRIEWELQRRISESPETFAHLAGCLVQIIDFGSGGPKYADRAAIVADIENALKIDNGTLEDNLTPEDLESGTMPEGLSLSRGLYGQFGGLDVQVNRLPGPATSQVTVSASAQYQYHMSELRKLLKSIIKKKDIPQSDTLLISTGCPDKTGYICPLDKWLFDSFVRHGLGGEDLEVEHLNGVVLHYFGTGMITEVYRSPAAELPWSKASPAT